MGRFDVAHQHSLCRVVSQVYMVWCGVIGPDHTEKWNSLRKCLAGPPLSMIDFNVITYYRHRMDNLEKHIGQLSELVHLALLNQRSLPPSLLRDVHEIKKTFWPHTVRESDSESQSSGNYNSASALMNVNWLSYCKKLDPNMEATIWSKVGCLELEAIMASFNGHCLQECWNHPKINGDYSPQLRKAIKFLVSQAK